MAADSQTPRADLARAETFGIKIVDEEGKPRSSKAIFDDLTALFEKMAAPAAAPKPAGGPKIMPYAIMRQAHESVRGALADASAALEAGNFDEAVKEWAEYKRALAVHMVMEDGHKDMPFSGIFKLLDWKSGNKVADDKIPDEHPVDQELMGKVDVASLETMKATLPAYVEAHLKHLQHEEDIMMPITPKTAETLEERTDLCHEFLMKPARALGPEEIAFFIKWNVTKLEKHKGGDSARVFCQAWQYSTTPDEWKEDLSAFKKAASAELYAKMCADHKIEEAGKASSCPFSETSWAQPPAQA